MKNILLVLFALISALSMAEFKPLEVDPAIAIVSQNSGNRVLVYSICSPEHCWSNVYLQKVSFGTEEPQIECSKFIDEIDFGYNVFSVDWNDESTIPAATLSTTGSHGGIESINFQLLPLETCGYEFKKLDAAG